MKTFTKDFIRNNAGCYTENGKGLTVVNALDFMSEPGEEIPYTWILESSIPTKDKYWFFCKKVFTKEQNQRLAIGVASIVLEIYEKKYPNDDRPRKAIKAAEDYLDGLIDIKTLREARRNVAAANYAAAAYYAAANAAAAAYYAAYYAANAANYANAANAANYAAVADLKGALILYLINFCHENL